MSIGPVHHSLLILDVERSGSHTDPEKVQLRANLYRLLMAAFARTGIMWTECRHEDRGDGVYVVVPPSIPKPLLAADLVENLVTLLTEHTATGGGSVPLRLRVGLHAGEVTFDAAGSSGTDVDTAFAMVDCEILRATLRTAPDARLAVVLSDPFFQSTVRQRYPGLDPDHYVPVVIETKYRSVWAWISVPGYDRPPTAVGSPATAVGPPAVEQKPVPEEKPAEF